MKKDREIDQKGSKNEWERKSIRWILDMIKALV